MIVVVVVQAAENHKQPIGTPKALRFTSQQPRSGSQAKKKKEAPPSPITIQKEKKKKNTRSQEK
jgi:hypothetical protein